MNPSMYYEKTNSSSMALINLVAWATLALSVAALYFLIVEEKDLLRSMIGLVQTENSMASMVKFYIVTGVISAAVAFKRGVIPLLVLLFLVVAVNQYGKLYSFQGMQGFSLNSLHGVNNPRVGQGPAKQQAAISQASPATKATPNNQKQLWLDWVARNGWITVRPLTKAEKDWCHTAEAKARNDALKKARCFTGLLVKPKQ